MKTRNSISEDFAKAEQLESNSYPAEFPTALTKIMHEAFNLTVIENDKADLINLIIDPAQSIKVFIENPESLNENLTRAVTGLLATQPDILVKRKRENRLAELIRSKEYQSLLKAISELKKKHPDWLYHLDNISIGRENRIAVVFLPKNLYS